MQSLRLQRVRELLKRQLGEVIRREYPLSEVGVITVNDVQPATDLHSATVFISVVGSEAQAKAALLVLHRDQKRIQHLVAQSVVLKYTPHLKFVIDESVARGNRVLEILDELEQRNPLPDEGPPEDH